MKKLIVLMMFVGAILQTTATENRITWGVGVITEGQWNMTNGKGGWANRLQADFGVRLWKGSMFDVSGLSTYSIGTPLSDDRQGFSNIDADNRAF